jgi:uncharacterized protein with beta-barrel porin domain
MNVLSWAKLTSTICFLIMIVVIFQATGAYSTDFTIESDEANNDPQTLGNNETGLIKDGGILFTVGDTAINANGNDITVDNYGSVISNLYGIISTGLNNTFNNYGSILTVRDGIFLTSGSDSNIINNFGEILRGDNYSVYSGIYAENSDNNIVNNNGVIESIHFENSSNNTINNYGTILRRVYIVPGGTSANNTINNYGDIFGSVTMCCEKQTLNLYPRSRIIGNILVNQVNSRVNLLSNGAGYSSTLTIGSAPNTLTVNLSGANMADLGGGEYIVVDPTGHSVNGAVLGSMTGSIHQILFQRPRLPANSPQVASTRLDQLPSLPSPLSQIWVSGFGSHRERDEDGQVHAYDHNYYGGVAGYETHYQKFHIGFLAGYAQSEVTTDIDSIDTDSDSFFIGAYGKGMLGSFRLDVSLLMGYEHNYNDRLVVDNLNGFETAEANFDSFFLSPSVTLSRDLKFGKRFALRPSATLTYSMGWYNSYTESGTTRSNLSIDDRLVNAFIGKLQLAATYKFRGSEFELLGGGRSRNTINNDVNASLAGVSFRYPASGDDTHFEAFVGGNVCLAISDSLNLTTGAQYALSDGIETTLSGNAGIEFTF